MVYSRLPCTRSARIDIAYAGLLVVKEYLPVKRKNFHQSRIDIAYTGLLVVKEYLPVKRKNFHQSRIDIAYAHALTKLNT